MPRSGQNKKRRISRPNRNDVLCGRGEHRVRMYVCMYVCMFFFIRLINIDERISILVSYIAWHIRSYLTYIVSHRIFPTTPHTTTHNITS